MTKSMKQVRDILDRNNLLEALERLKEEGFEVFEVYRNSRGVCLAMDDPDGKLIRVNVN